MAAAFLVIIVMHWGSFPWADVARVALAIEEVGFPWASILLMSDLLTKVTLWYDTIAGRSTTRAGLAAGSMRRTHDLQTTIERANQEQERGAPLLVTK